MLITTWKWGPKYSVEDVHRLQRGIERHLRQPHRFLCFTDDARGLLCEAAPIQRQDIHMTKVRGCFARLRMFDRRAVVGNLAIEEGTRIVCLDLDVVVTGELDPLFDRPDPFVILGGANAANPCPFNGSVMMLRAGSHPEVWNDFNFDREVAWRKGDSNRYHEFADDQGWIWHKLPSASTWQVGPRSGIYAFQKPGWPKGTDLPPDARMVVFPGWRSPQQFSDLPWVKEHWR